MALKLIPSIFRSAFSSRSLSDHYRLISYSIILRFHRGKAVRPVCPFFPFLRMLIAHKLIMRDKLIGGKDVKRMNARVRK